MNDNINKKILSLNEQTNEQYMLNSFLKEFKKNYNSPISNLFYGIIETKSHCFGSISIKYNFQIYNLLEFPLQQINQYYLDKGEKQFLIMMEKIKILIYINVLNIMKKKDLFNGENQMNCNYAKN